MDLAAPYGEPVYSAGNGRVISAGYSPGYGRTVHIRHGGGYSTLYAHMSRILVRKGETIRIGQRIGKVGSTGMSTGNHLHFELQKTAGCWTRWNGSAGGSKFLPSSIIRRVMNIEEAKRIPLEDYLRRMGFSPVKEQGDSLWYRSPFRQERTPSFKVSLSRNL